MQIVSGAYRMLKPGLLALSFLLALPEITHRFADVDSFKLRAAFLVLLALLWGGLIGAAYIRRAAIRWPTALILAVGAYYMMVFERVTTEFMTYDAFINMMNSAGFIGDALAQNRVAFTGAALPALVLLAALGLRPQGRRRAPAWLPVVSPWFAVAVLTGLLFLRGGDGARGQPPAYTPIAYLALAGYESVTGNLGPRLPVHIPIARAPRARNIVFVIDESIAGQYLDINSANGVETPLSKPWPGAAIVNYGLAASITNCSAGSNVTLRHGGTREDYQRINAVEPSIWAYAHKAGLETVYIDGQRSGGALQNLMTDAERAEIDRFVQFDKVPVVDRDMAAAKLLVQELADPRPKLVVINKVGGHFPVHDKYPDAYMHYRPVLPRGHFGNITDTGSRAGFSGSPADWVLYRNAYRDTLLWNVGAFFQTVLSQGDLAHTTIIYTSDHGQNLHERGNPGLFTHCSADPAPEEGTVPLAVIDGGTGSGLDWTKFAAHNRDRSSHYMIFPTLLALMGYDRAAVEKLYGRALDEESHDPGTFNTLFNARLNRKPTWLAINPAHTVQSPISDYRTTAPPAL